MATMKIKVGDTIIRLLAESVPMELKVTEIDDELIYCGPKGEGWTFDRVSGIEVDDDLGWGPKYGRTGSRIVGVKPPVSPQGSF